MLLNLFSLLGSSATAPGATPLGMVTAAWTYTGSTVPAPVAPVAYNSDIDFAGFANGVYEYTYEVTLNAVTEESTVTVVLNNHIALPNDACLGALPIPLPVNPTDREDLVNQSTNGICPGYGPPTDSGEALPALWGAGPFSGDLWYSFVLPSGTVNADLTFSASGLAYGAQGGTDFNLAVYSGNCAALVEEGSAVPPFAGAGGTVLPNLIFSNAGPGADTYYIRVVSLSGTPEGQFTVSITRNA